VHGGQVRRRDRDRHGRQDRGGVGHRARARAVKTGGRGEGSHLRLCCKCRGRRGGVQHGRGEEDRGVEEVTGAGEARSIGARTGGRHERHAHVTLRCSGSRRVRVGSRQHESMLRRRAGVAARLRRGGEDGRGSGRRARRTGAASIALPALLLLLMLLQLLLLQQE